MRLGIVTAFTALSSLLSASLLALPTGSAAAPPAPEVFDLDLSERSVEDPVTVSRDPERPVPLELHLYAGDPAQDVRVTVQGAGLSVTPAVRRLGDLAGGDLLHPRFRVVAETPGMHSLTFTVTSADRPAQSLTVPYVWAAGGNPIPGGGDLSPRAFADQSNERTPNGPVRRVSMLTFLNGRAAFIGFPRHGRPRCRGLAGRWERTRGCVPYRYDPRTGLVQVGGLLGRWQEGGLYIENLVPRDPLYDDVYSRIFLRPNVRFARPGERFAGTWRHRDPKQRPGLDWVRLVLRKNRTYALRYRYAGRKPVRRTGRYRVAAAGRLTLPGRPTLLVDRNRRVGGLWLGLTRPGGKADAVHLVRRR